MLLLNILGDSMGSDYSWLSSKFSITLVSAFAKAETRAMMLLLQFFNLWVQHLNLQPVFIVLTCNTLNTQLHGDALTPTCRIFPRNRKFSFREVVGVSYSESLAEYTDISANLKKKENTE